MIKFGIQLSDLSLLNRFKQSEINFKRQNAHKRKKICVTQRERKRKKAKISLSSECNKTTQPEIAHDESIQCRRLTPYGASLG
jgi:hypothetical protein